MKDKKIFSKINDITSCFFEKISKFDKPFAGLMKKKERMQIDKIENERGDVIPDTREIERIVKRLL